MENMPEKFEGDIATLLKILGVASTVVLVVCIIMLAGVYWFSSEQAANAGSAKIAAFLL